MEIQPGRLFVTPSAFELELEHGIITDALLRHLDCDWSEMAPEDAALNRYAVEHGGRVFSAYQYDQHRIWVITEADRSMTTVLLPDEY